MWRKVQQEEEMVLNAVTCFCRLGRSRVGVYFVVAFLEGWA